MRTIGKTCSTSKTGDEGRRIALVLSTRNCACEHAAGSGDETTS